MSLLDFNGKFNYLADLFTAQVSSLDEDLVRQIAFYFFSFGPILFTVLALVLVNSPLAKDDTTPPKGCSRYGLRKKSNLSDEVKASQTRKNPLTVKSLWIYPVKGCQGVELEEAEVIDTGVKYDRQFSFAQLHSPFPLSAADTEDTKSAHQWRFISQREFPLLSQITPELWVPDPSLPDYSPDLPYVKTGGALIIRYPYEEDGWRGALKSLAAKLRFRRPEKSFIVPYAPTPEQIKQDYKIEPFKIWSDVPQSINMAQHVPPELKYYLGVRNPLSIFRVSSLREVFRCAPRKETLGWQPITGFADAYPLNLVGLSSVHAASDMQPHGSPALRVLRFRPNIVLAGSEPFAEDSWTKIRIGSGEYHVACRCVRCKVPNIDLETGARHQVEPYKTLITKRNIDTGAPNLGCMGMQMVPVLQEGKMAVGDVIEVLGTGEHEYIK
jgi:uncharacterized protein YcbX